MQRVERIFAHLEPQGPLVASAKALFDGQVAVVTGAGQGIGREAALLFARQGAAVVVSDLDAARSDAVAEEIRREGGRSVSCPGDVTRAGYGEEVLGRAVREFGKVTIVVANAGYTWDAVIHKMTDKQWDAMIDVHASSVFRLVRACATYMREPAKKVLEEGGVPEMRSIVLVSSTSGTRGNAGQLNYSAAKSAVLGMAKTIAREWGAFNIRCNAVSFGHISTRLTAEKKDGASITTPEGEKIALGIPGAARAKFDAIPLRRPGTPEEAGASIVMLASPWAAYVTGQTLEVTGGI